MDSMRNQRTPTHTKSIDVQVLLAAIQASGVGIVISDTSLPDNPLIFVNDGFCAISGYAREEVVGRNCRFLQGDRTDKTAVEQLRSAIRSKSPISVRLVNHRKDGRIFHNELHMSPVLDEHGHATHFVGVQHDVTAQVEAEANVRDLTERLTRSNESLQSFADTTAREMLAALRPILMYAESLQSTAVGQRAEELAVIHSAAFRARAFVTQLLEYSSVLSARLDTCQISWKSLFADLDRTPGVVSVRFDEAPTSLRGDAALLRQSITALLDNALKFVAPDQAPCVEISVGSAPGQCVIEVADRGIGIDPQHMQRVTEPFIRLHASSKYPGAGLGLALASRVAERHGGRLHLFPRAGGGTVAQLVLPVPQAAASTGRSAA